MNWLGEFVRTGSRNTCAPAACFVLAFAALPSMVVVSAARAQQLYEFEVSSAYWCNHPQINGQISGSQCEAEYVADTGACDKFEQLEPDDADMRRTIDEIRSSEVCIGETVDQAKSKTLRLRTDLMGYVTAGSDESVNDPTSPNSSDIIERAKNGGAPYWPLVTYYLYQCVVEVCESK